MAVEVSSVLLERLLVMADEAYPNECCGILMGDTDRINAIHPARNVHPDPARRFEIDPQALFDAHREARSGNYAVFGYYHSHPNGLAEPSATDRAHALGDGRIWAIIAAGKVSFWRDGGDGFEALSYTVFDG